MKIKKIRKYEVLNNEALLKERVTKSNSYSDMLRFFNLPIISLNVNKLKEYMLLYNINFNHFEEGRKISFRNAAKEKSKIIRICGKKLLDMFIKDSTANYKVIKIYLIRYYAEINKKIECNICGLIDWQSKPIVLQMDHIDGNHTNNQLENLRLICPNCHSQTDTYCGRNIKNDDIIRISSCKDCGQPTTSKVAIRCIPCRTQAARKIVWPSLEELLEMLKTTNFEALGRKLGVDGNAIRKMIKNEKKKLEFKS